MDNPPAKPPYNGNPSFNIWVYLPSKPCIRIFIFPELSDVCCICTPVVSRKSIPILLEFIAAFSPNSSPVMASTRVGMSSIVLEDRVAATIIEIKFSHGDRFSVRNIVELSNSVLI